MKNNYFGLSRSTILKLCGFVGFLGCFSVVITDVIGVLVVDGYNPVSQTISDLAIDRKAWIQDMGLNLFAVSFAACGTGFLLLKRGDWKWKAGSCLLFVLAADILIISEFDRYADLDSFGSTVHFACVIVLAVVFTLMLILTANGLPKLGRRWRLFNLALAFLWAATAPFFFVVSDSWNGLYERLLSLIVIAWVLSASRLLWYQGNAQHG